MTATIVIKGWEKFQHYKDRDPPWIKLYRDILTSESWVLGTDASRLVQIASTLLAARYQNATPLHYTLFRKVASLDVHEADFIAAIRHLEATGFLEIQGDAVPCTMSASTLLATCTSETETETETETEKKVPTEPVERSRSTEGVETVFRHWQSVHSHPTAKLDDKRRRVIRTALSNYTADELCEAISGYRNSPHHMGQNDRNTVYDSIELLLRDASHIDAGLKFARDPPRSLSKLTRQNISNTEAWLPPEARSAG